MQFERIPNGRSQRFLTDVHTHKLTATLPVYPSKKDTSASTATDSTHVVHRQRELRRSSGSADECWIVTEEGISNGTVSL